MALYRTDDGPRWKQGDVFHIGSPFGPNLAVIVPRAMTYSEAYEYGTWMVAKHFGRDPRPHRKIDRRLATRWPGNLQ
jgi:hypothetical protein